MSSAGAPAVTAEEMDAMLNQAFTEYDMDQSGCALYCFVVANSRANHFYPYALQLH
jgi:hypothetical protein